MDTDKIIEKLMKWLADPKGREMFKTIVYLIVPVLFVIGLRNAVRRKQAAHSSAAIEPKMRSTTYENISGTESISQTMARERKKVEKDLEQLFGRRQTTVDRTRKELKKSPAIKKTAAAPAQEYAEKNVLQEELLKLFSRRSD
jgi:Skp family chaperone for outer membrane proteins